MIFELDFLFKCVWKKNRKDGQTRMDEGRGKKGWLDGKFQCDMIELD